MSDLSNQMITTFENVITMYREAANILTDAEALLEGKNYYCLHRNTAGTEQSKSIIYPQKWITPYVVRIFSNETIPTKQYSIGIFFVDKAFTPINPLIVLGVFDMDKDEDGEILGFQYWYLKEAWFSLVEGNELNTIYNFQECWTAKSGKVMAKNLESIQGQEDIIEIVDDLLKL